MYIGILSTTIQTAVLSKVNYYPNCSTELFLQAVKKILDDKATGLREINKECILEAPSITLSSYNGQF